MLLPNLKSKEKEIREMTSRRLTSLILLAFFLSAAAGDPNSAHCVYTVYVATGSVIKGGTDSKISVTFGDASGRGIRVPDLEAWGLMGPGHDYYERGNLDIFSGRGPCIGAPICSINVTSDGTGKHHGWYCEYVEVTSTGPQIDCSQTNFHIDQWLATDAPPYQLTALLNGCGPRVSEHARTGGRFVVGKRPGSVNSQ